MTDEKTELHLYDDPESKIRFLELALGTGEWKATLHFPSFDPKGRTQIAEIERTLRMKGYKTERTQRQDGYITLGIHHLGETPNIAGLFKDYGISAGTAHVIQNPVASTQALLDGIGHGARYAQQFIKDPARANGLIFLTAEAFLILAAGGSKHGKWYHPKNALQGLAGTLFAGQSAAYLFWAQKGDDRITEDLAKQLDKNGDTNFQDLLQAEALNQRPTKGWLEKARRTLEDHPIQSGAVMNNLGMLSYMAHAVLERRHHLGILKKNPFDKKSFGYVANGFLWDIGGSLLSILGWSSLLITPKEFEKKSENPIEKLWQDYQENPQALTAVTSLLSSSQRLMGALSKGNKTQAIGESIYIPGDILLFFIKNHDYGASRHGDYDDLLDKVSQVMIAMPMVTDSASREQLFDSTAEYLARQHYALAHQHQEIPAEKLAEEKTKLKEGLVTRCEGELNQRYDLMIGSAKRLIDQFPAEQRVGIGKQLAETLPSLHGLHADSKALENDLCLDQPAVGANTPHAMTMEQLAPAIGQLVFAIPGPYAGENATKIYDALAPHVTTSPGDKEKMENELMQVAESMRPTQMNQPGHEQQLTMRSSHHRHSASSR